MTVTVGPISLPLNQVIYVGCLLTSYLLSSLYYHFLLFNKHSWIKHLYLSLWGQSFLFLCFPLKSVLLLYSAVLFTWTWCRFARSWPHAPLINFIIIMTFLSFFHLKRQWAEGGSSVKEYVLDITGPLMMITIKLSSFAFDMLDAHEWNVKRRIMSQRSSVDNTSAAQLVESRAPPSNRVTKGPLVLGAEKFAILRRYPSLMEFMGYVFLFPGVLTGPTLPFYEYRTFINGSYFKGVDATKGSLSGRKRRAAYLFTVSIIFMIIYIALGPVFNPHNLISTDFQLLPWWKRLLIVHITHLVGRSKYYFAWLVAEGSYVISGLGFRLNASGKPLWDRLENVDPFRIESVTDFKLLVSGWNVCTNQWLNAYVYRRFLNWLKGRNLGSSKSSGSRASLFTYVISAFWHGFYPGYYLMFSTAALMTIAARLLYRNFTWPFSNGTLKRLLIFIPLHLLIDYIVTPFILLDWNLSIKYWKSMYFMGHVVIVILLILGTILRNKK